MLPADAGSAVPLGMSRVCFHPALRECTEVLGTDEVSRMQADRTESWVMHHVIQQ